MIGKYINEKSLNREDACRFIANRCKDCELSTYCSDKYSCIEKEKYLIDKYDLDSQLPKMHMRFPETLEVLLAYKHTSVRKFSEYSGISEASIRGWLAGKNSPTCAQIYRICDYFQITPNFLLGYDGACDSIVVNKSVSSIQAELDDIVNGLDILCESITYTQKKLNQLRFGGDNT